MIDIDTLAFDLADAGYTVSKNKRLGIYEIGGSNLQINPSGLVFVEDMDGEPIILDDGDFAIIDLIRGVTSPALTADDRAALRRLHRWTQFRRDDPVYGEPSRQDGQFGKDVARLLAIAGDA